MRYFEKISLKQFKKDICNDKSIYDKIKLPNRKTKYSAGYDLESAIDIVIKPHQKVKIPTGLKANMNEDEVMLIFIRSSIGFKGLRMRNSVGVIDKDYYNNEDNEGHFFVGIENTTDEGFHISFKERIAQAIFVKYLTVDDEEEITGKRKGGFGSTNKE